MSTASFRARHREQLRRLRELVSETGALKHGDFTLSSGVKSTFYFDGKRLTYHPEGASLIGLLLHDLLEDTGVQAVGGLTMGADPITVAVALASHARGRPLYAFSVRKEVKAHGTGHAIEGSLPEGRSVRVAVVEDVITTGASAMLAIKALEGQGHRVEQVVALVDRQQGGSESLRQQGYKFQALFRLDERGRLSLYRA